ncbi:hypothetical protein J8L98_22545 [Pseudoalteromonas sp. MMG013]|uniref:hypothetical protein n=1 Tax=Pseudoalteromonas sp. MMG013 TaxID=2822687 RepID=UPI001B38853C|nr:hypothetical protein [Pseudoalteromonas sp. MMG013]MBQ4864475.1 hypothetical protein [Pseudoalteromonas sp. MMG013]
MEVYRDNNWIKATPAHNERVRERVSSGALVEYTYIDRSISSELVIQLSNTTVTSPNAKLIGNIWWLPKDESFTITANATGLPDGGLMVMVERVINATQPVDDIRFVANIKDGIVTMQGKFEQSGNYIITAKRLNAGLERIEAPFRLAFEPLEFDAYVSA